ncbi:hypothetical protein AAFF_G00068960 [Aldrovandia affinis]|uniref:Uncharacterized protein n=1 Tax=Aldrovandia affinis TaxID=143900 RepID=A0AAD7RZC5_9TELE|nr:hypothetical protein AAFF_G00068960 [Aldrovandia affinis]
MELFVAALHEGEQEALDQAEEDAPPRTATPPHNILPHCALAVPSSTLSTATIASYTFAHMVFHHSSEQPLGGTTPASTAVIPCAHTEAQECSLRVMSSGASHRSSTCLRDSARTKGSVVVVVR